jgi:hypothetical protein
MKINGQEVVGDKFAYDGCHKIYVIESIRDREEAKDSGYDIIPISELKKKYNKSCGLQFISNWSLSKSYVRQFEDAEFEA